MRVNYLSPVAMAMAVLPPDDRAWSGTIVNVSSLGGRLGITTEAADLWPRSSPSVASARRWPPTSTGRG